MIWLIGNRGMLGQEVKIRLQQENLAYFATDREVDICDMTQLEKMAQNYPDIRWIVNCSAYTAVDRAEQEKEAAFAVNSQGTENLARLAKKLDARLIHVSTDYVFDGQKQGAYQEEDRTNPLGVYGKSKREGEERIQKISEKNFIIRVSWLFGKYGNNFVYTMLRLFQERESLKVVRDQIGSPTYAKDLADLILTIIRKDSKDYGIYHFTNLGETSWYGFAQSIYEKGKKYGLVQKDVKILPISTEEYPTPAPRPKNSRMSKEKVIRTFSLTILSWEQALEDFLKDLGQKENKNAKV